MANKITLYLKIIFSDRSFFARSHQIALLPDTPSSKNEVISLTTESENVEAVPLNNGRRSVGQRKPQRDKVGE
ncbi:hypothetical protein LC612_29760 [Nostoc sp. CHAB 5834]|nr:hypothetical protein [Nostoc sp. CHAB 5834]